MRRKLAAALALAVALLVQLTIVNGLALPGSGTPDLVLLCVIAIGMTGGPASGVAAGFGAGLALDLAPPASQLVGQYALVLCLIGYWSGRLRFVLRHSAGLAVAAAAAMAALGEALSAVLTLALDTPEVTRSTVGQVLPPTVLYDVALAPVILLCSVRLAVAIGVSFDPHDDSPAQETGGSAAPAIAAGVTAAPGIAGMNAATQLQRARQRRAALGGSRAAASGRWLVGDVAFDTPAMGSIGWLSGPASSRRARREQARLTATIIGVTPRKGAFWVGRRPPGLHPLTPLVPQKARGLARLRPGAGAAGSAAARPGPSYHARFGRPVRLGLADEQRQRARAASSRARARGHVAYGANRHGLDRHGLNGPAVPRIAFSTSNAGGRSAHGPAGLIGRPARYRTHRIAFGTGSLPGAGRAAGRPPPRIAFGTPGLGPSGAGPIGAGQFGAGRGGLIGVGGAAIRSAHGGRKPKQPRFSRSAASQPVKARRPKTARIGPSHGVLHGLSWFRRPGDRSTVWRVGSRRMSGYG